MPTTRKPTITLHAVASLDGFIARPDNSVAWLEGYEDVYDAGVSGAGADEMESVIDCFVMGSRTYELALQIGWPYGDIPAVVVTTRTLPRSRSSVEFFSGDLRALVNETLAPRFSNIWLVGGAELSQRFLELGLVDDIRLTIAPILLGDGLRLFGRVDEVRWRLKKVAAHKNGFVELQYGR